MSPASQSSTVPAARPGSGGEPRLPAGLADQVPPYELFRALFSRRSRAQLAAWGTPFSPDELDAICIFGPREDDQPVPG